MSTTFRSLILSGVSCICASCEDVGSGGATRPTPLPLAETVVSTELSVISGESQMPVRGAVVTVAGKAFETDSSGQVSLTRSATRSPYMMIQAEGFLLRESRLRPGAAAPLSLWPLHSPTGLSEEATRQIVYTLVWGDTAPGESPLVRAMPEHGMFIVPSAEILSHVRAMRSIEESVEALRAALGEDAICEVAGTPPPGGMIINISIDAARTGSEYIVVWKISWRNWRLIAAELVYRSLQAIAEYPSVVTHNLGHAFGLMHSPDPSDRMCEEWWRRRGNGFSEREVLLMKLMRQRVPGNRFPDSDRDVLLDAIPASRSLASHSASGIERAR